MEQQEWNETMETRTAMDNEKALASFKDKFDNELLPIYENAKQVKAGVIMDAFTAFANGSWDDFLTMVKEDVKQTKGDDTNE